MVYYIYNINELDEQCMGGEYICYKHNCIFIPKKLDEKYQISHYYYYTFKLQSLFNIESDIFMKIKHIKIETID